MHLAQMSLLLLTVPICVLAWHCIAALDLLRCLALTVLQCRHALLCIKLCTQAHVVHTV